MKRKPITVPQIISRKGSTKIVMLTAYDTPTAAILDEAGVDIVLVGDSVGTAHLGYSTTLPVRMPEILHHIRAVARGIQHCLIVGDLPFGSYQISPAEAKRNAIECIKAGAHAVKLEGSNYAIVIEELVQAGIPVMGHIGLTPQSIHKFGGYKIQGKQEHDRIRLVESAEKLQNAGVFSIVIECVPALTAKAITDAVTIPTIGIGAGLDCDGQVLVITDLLGTTPHFKPKFVKQYANLHSIITDAVKQFSDDVRGRSFPTPEFSYHEENE